MGRCPICGSRLAKLNDDFNTLFCIECDVVWDQDESSIFAVFADNIDPAYCDFRIDVFENQPDALFNGTYQECCDWIVLRHYSDDTDVPFDTDFGEI